MRGSLKKYLSLWPRYCSEQCGAAAVEFALVLTLLTVPLLNVADFAFYAWDRMQLDNAAQSAAQAAWAECDPSKLPATSNCPNIGAKVSAGAHLTSLGGAVNVASGTSTPPEGYYCTDTSGNLVPAGPITSARPANCSASGGLSSDVPGDYVQITVSYTYTPIFPAVSIASSLASPITRTAWMRLG